MIPNIPADPPYPADPTCCEDVFDYAAALLEWIWTGTVDDPGIAECVGEDDSECGTMVRYVSWGPPIIRPTVARNLLAVYLLGPALEIRYPPRGGNSPAVQLARITDVNFGIELWEGCYPVPGDDGNGPTYAQWHEANRHAYAHGVKLFTRLAGGAPSAILGGCQSQRVGPLVPISPGEPGLTVGWRTSLRVTW